MKFLELNKKRHAVKSFNDQKVDFKDLRTAIEIATLAPSANNIQPWKFVVVENKKADLAKDMVEGNKVQIEQAQYVIAVFSDTDLAQRSRKIARVGVKSLPDDLIGYYMETLPPRYDKFQPDQKSDYLAFNTGLVAMNFGVKSLPDDLIGYYMETLPPRYDKFQPDQKSDYLAFNTGLVAMNLVLALTDQKISSNMILGFDKTIVNEILDVDSRFRPEILITVGYSDEHPEPSLTDQKISSNMILGFDKTIVNEILDVDSRFRPEILITVGYSDEHPEPSYRLPVDELIERR